MTKQHGYLYHQLYPNADLGEKQGEVSQKSFLPVS